MGPKKNSKGKAAGSGCVTEPKEPNKPKEPKEVKKEETKEEDEGPLKPPGVWDFKDWAQDQKKKQEEKKKEEESKSLDKREKEPAKKEPAEGKKLQLQPSAKQKVKDEKRKGCIVSSSSESLDKRDSSEATTSSLDKRESSESSSASLVKREAGASFDKKEGQSTASLDKREALPPPPRRNPPPPPPARSQRPEPYWRLKCNPEWKVAVDWYNTIRLVGRIPDENIRALQRLTALGFKVVLVSFCGRARSEEVRQEARALPVEWDDLCFTKKKSGRGGKLEACHRLGCGQIIDDDEEVLWECHENNFKHYPIRTHRKTHSWAHETYRDLPAAVDALLRSHGIR
eukprot:s2315_g14.t1